MENMIQAIGYDGNRASRLIRENGLEGILLTAPENVYALIGRKPISLDVG